MPTQTEPTAELYTKAIAFMTEFFGHPLELDQDAREKWYRDHGLLIQFIERQLREDYTRLLAIFPRILTALDNGSGCTTAASIEFLEDIPKEISLCIQKIKYGCKNPL